MRPIEELLSEMDKAMDKKFGKNKNGNRRAALLKGLFDEANAANASLLIAKAGSGDLSKKIAENTNAEGTAKLVADDMSNNTVGAAKELDSAYEELQLTVGSLLIPTMRDLLVWTKETTEGFTAWTKDNPVLTQVLGATAMVVGGLAIGTWGLVTAIGAATTAYGAYNKVISLVVPAGNGVIKILNFMKLALLSNPITAIILGIAVAATLIYTYWDPIKSFFADLWEGVKATFSGVWDWILNKVEWLGGKVRWLKEELLGMRAGIDFSEMDKSLRDQVAKLSKADLEIAAKGTGKVAEAAQAKIRLDSLAASAPGLMADMKASAATAMSSIMPTGEGAANSLGAALTPAPLLPTQKGKPIMPTLPGSGSFRGELNIKVSGAQVDNAALKTSGDAGFVVRMNTGTQG